MSNATGRSLQDKLAAEINGLVSEGKELLEYVKDEDPTNILPFAARYHTWYTRALAVVKTLALDRLDEFRLYERDNKRKILDAVSYVIEDYVQGVQPSPNPYKPELKFDVMPAAFVKLYTQVEIISSCASRLSDILANIRGVLQADLFDSELDAARHLKQNGHLRAAGAVAGVVLEGHLAEVCRNHNVPMKKKDPHISDFNEALKAAGIFDVARWRGIQSLADIRNLCDHKKQRDPKPDEVDDLIDGVAKAIKTLM